ncbi:YqhA family protein [Vibrio metschnikovii]
MGRNSIWRYSRQNVGGEVAKEVLDISLIAITFQIIAASLYRLFIRPSALEASPFLSALAIRNFHDLKITLLQVAVVIMIILFLRAFGGSGCQY